MSLNLRKRTRLSYYEPAEPNFDEYLYCERCADFVYDYCAIHGPLLVVPDSAGLGVFSTLTLPRGVRFGPYCGLRTQNADSMYCWQIYDSTNKRSHVLDAMDSDRSNWMRYVNCARHSKEQNLLAYQYKGQLYYRTIKIIPRYTELMVFYGSEFANALNINLSKYNSAKYYKEIISTATKSLQENNDYMQEEYVTADQFHFIDEDLDGDDNNKKSTKIGLNSKNLGTNIDDSSLNEIARSDKENKEVSKENTQTRYECEICQKTFAAARYLKYHAITHLNTWKFNCEYCLFKSNKHYSFKQHVGKHTNTYKFSCETCPFKTNYGKNFKRHCFRHESSAKVSGNIRSPDKVNFPMTKTCEICDFKTFSRKVFTTHMAKHKGIVYKCDNCSYSNYSKYNLSRHIARLRH